MSDCAEAENQNPEIPTPDELARLNRLCSLGELAAGIIHEINSPIGSIFSNIDVLQKSVDVIEKQTEACSTPKTKQVLAMMRTLLSVDRVACERISGIVRSLKTQAREGSEDFREANVNEILEDSIRLVNAEYRRRVRVITEFGELPPALCIPHLIGQASLNILVNAVQAIEGEGTVSVRTRLEENQVVIEIEDSGIGMNDECRKRVFASGFTTKAVGVGTGLGLMITKQIIIDKHHGTINFESEPDKGTTFYLKFPLRPPADKE